MKSPLVILIAIVVCILGFLAVYSQQHDMIAKAPGQGVAGGYGKPRAGAYGAAPAAGGYGKPRAGAYGAVPPAAGYGKIPQPVKPGK